MLEWRVEARKHTRFFGFALLVIGVILAAHLVVDNQVTDVLWVFGVVLVSFSAAAYCAAHLFLHHALGSDLLFHMSTQGTAKKFVLKTLPLVVGFALVGAVTLSGSLISADDGLGSAALYAYGAKLVSICAFVALVWVLAKAVANLGSPSTKALAFGTLFAVFVGLQAYGHWSYFSLSGQPWSVGASTDFAGLPTYLNVLAVNVGEPDGAVTSGMYGSLIVNLVTVLLGVAAELLLFSRFAARHSDRRLVRG